MTASLVFDPYKRQDRGRLGGGGGRSDHFHPCISSGIMQSIVLLKSSHSLSSETLTFGPKSFQDAVKQSFYEGEFFICVCGWCVYVCGRVEGGWGG